MSPHRLSLGFFTFRDMGANTAEEAGWPRLRSLLKILGLKALRELG